VTPPAPSPRASPAWITALLGAVFALGVVNTLNFARDIGQPFGGFLVSRRPGLSVWQVEISTPPWWTVIAQGQVNYDDHVITLNGQPYDANARPHYREAARRGASFQLTIQRGGQVREQTLPLRRFSFSDFIDVKLPNVIVGLGFWLLAVAVYRVRPHGSLNQLFAVGFGLSAGALWLTIEGLFPEADPFSMFLRLAWIGVVAALGANFIHLAMLFPVPIESLPPRLVKGLYLVSGLIAALYALASAIRWATGTAPFADALADFGFQFVLGAFGAGVVFFALRLVWLLARPGSRRLRRQLALLLASLIAALPFVLTILTRALLSESLGYFWGGLDLRYLALAVPLAFAFIVLRYQTFHSTHPLLVWVLMFGNSGLLASLGVWLLRSGGQDLSGADGSIFLLLFVTAFAASAFWGSQSGWQAALSRLFQWEQRSYAAARQVGQQILAPLDLQRLPDLIASALVARMEVESAGVWRWDEAERAFHLAGQAARTRPAILPARLPCEEQAAFRQPVRLAADHDPLPEWLQPVRESRAIEVVIPLWASGELIGLLGLGRRLDEDIFDERDLEIIELISEQAALFLLAAQQVEQLRQVPHQITATQERERFRIAQELHDTTQQFLGRLPFYLEVSHGAIRTDPAEAEAILQRLQSEVQSAAQTLRQIRLNLAPAQLEHSLRQPLHALAEHFRAQTGLEAQLVAPPEIDSALSTNARHALYRVVQQALDNVAAHAQARCVTVTLDQQNGRLAFTITDDGRGFSGPEADAARARGSFGLTSMRTRITSLGGELAVHSAPGAGTTISGWLPVK